MSFPRHRIRIFNDGGVEVTEATPEGLLPSNMRFVRVLHELELPSNKRTNPERRPEVRPLFVNQYVPFNQQWQEFSWNLNDKRYFTAGNMTAIYHYRLWIANYQGFGDPTDPRRNYFENTNSGYPLPRVEALTCGGNVLRVIGETQVKVGRVFVPAWAIESLDWHKPPPSVQELRSKPWLITTAVNLSGANGLTPSKFPQGNLPDGNKPGVVHPLLADPTVFTVAVEKWRVVDWQEPNPPDPYRLYLS